MRWPAAFAPRGGGGVEKARSVSRTVASRSGEAERLAGRGSRSAGRPRRTDVPRTPGRPRCARGHARRSTGPASPRRPRRRRRTAAPGPGWPQRDLEPLQPGVGGLGGRRRDLLVPRGAVGSEASGVGSGVALGPGEPSSSPSAARPRPGSAAGCPPPAGVRRPGRAGSTSQVTDAIRRRRRSRPASAADRPGRASGSSPPRRRACRRRVNVMSRRRGSTSAVSWRAVRARHQREEGAGPAVGGRVPALRALAERMHAEPVDAGVGRRRAAERGTLTENCALSPGLDPVDGVVGAGLGDPRRRPGPWPAVWRGVGQLVGGGHRLGGDEASRRSSSSRARRRRW